MSDECPTKIDNRDEVVFSSRTQLIANPILRGIVWLMGVSAFIGNIVVIAVESKFFYKSIGKRLSTPTRTNHMLIFNLALADFLMGVYLIMLGIAGVVFDGVFCAKELNWRSGNTCQVMGALVVISSETSVLTLVLLASVRLFAILEPFSASSKPSRRTVLFLITLTWTIAIFVAVLPFSTHLQNVFTDRAIIRDNLFFRNVVVRLNSVKEWAEKLVTFSPELQFASQETVFQIRNAVSWADLRSVLGNVSLTNILDTQSFIGYYGANSVCIPRLFVTPMESSSQFSIAVTIFNFLAFAFVAFAYISIVLKTKRKRLRSQNSGIHLQNEDKIASAMQRKVYRLLATDFCCWVPITIMALINFSGIRLSDLAYVISAIVLLPINSSLNPILYSNIFDKFIGKVHSFFRRFSSSQCWSSTDDLTPDSKEEQISSIPTMNTNL